MDIKALYLSDIAAWCKVTGDIPRVKNHYLNGELLTDLVIPEDVTAISPNVFSWSESITSVTIPNTVTEIGAYAFYACINLKTALIPNSVKEIKKGTFRFCNNLEKIIIGNSLRTLGDNAFDNCNQLKDFYIGNRVPPTAEENVFSYDVTHGDSATLHVPKNSIPDYRMSSVWSQFPHIVEYDASGIENVTPEEETGFSVSGGVLTVNGVDGAMIEIYDMSGRLVYEDRSPVVSGLPRGIYLLKAGNRTAKIHI